MSVPTPFRFRRAFSAAFLLGVLLALPTFGRSEERIRLDDGESVAKGWRFDNGQEFPGAKGSLTADSTAFPRGGDSLKLVGDFTGGGGYVQACKSIPEIDIRELSFWVKGVGSDKFTMRLGDGSDQTHQIVLKLEPGEEWQEMVFPLEQFFSERGKAGAVASVAKYESWGGAKDGNWHGPAQYICFLLGNDGSDSVRTLWLRDIEIAPTPKPVAGAEVTEMVVLDEVSDGFHEWKFSNGAEFKGATGELSVVDGEAGMKAFKLEGDFTKGGAYVAAIRNLEDFNVTDVNAFRMRAKSENAESVSVQLVDSTGQTHQRKGVPIKADGAWNELVIEPTKIAGGEHWGGSNDGKWHGPAKQFVISLTSGSDPEGKRPELMLSSIRAECTRAVFAQSAAYDEDFESGKLSEGWDGDGEIVTIDGRKVISLGRTLEDREKAVSLSGPMLSVNAGTWLIRLRAKSGLNSPDNSYHAGVTLECYGEGGEVLEVLPVTEIFGKLDWEIIEASVTVPKGAKSARLKVGFNKAWGDVWFDEFSVSPLAPAPMQAARVERLLFSTERLGNLLFPEDSRTVGVEIECRKPLSENDRLLTWTVRDYWGAEQSLLGEVPLGAPEVKEGKVTYKASFNLAGAPLEIGRYYEVHASAAGFENYTGIAILPEAVTRKYKPEEVPFTARNWDNRIPEYIRLTDRLGVRICGLWGGWSSRPPYKPEAPGLELVKELGMGWLTTTPAAQVERGSDEYDEKSLREGMGNFLEAFGDYRPLIINIGNEPHGTGEVVTRNVAAYRAIYEEVKKFDPKLPVVATSVEPNEEYFKAGYGKWCDAFDFHIYESAENVRRTIGEYRALQKKYEVEKPIWTTELGLNSQGMTRLAVASELPKKFATFFAAGGENVSWFGFLYPDADGKNHGSSGEAHNVFDSRFNRYNPKLDAVAYYHAVNAISVKKFVEEKNYEGGVRAVMFRDTEKRSLVVLWKEKGRADVEIKLAGVEGMRHVEIDGRTAELTSKDGAFLVTVTEDPLLLLFEGEVGLPEAIRASGVRFVDPPKVVSRGGTTVLSVEAPGYVDLVTPYFWMAKKVESGGEGGARYSVEAAVKTVAREAEFVLQTEEGNARIRLRLLVQ